MPNYQIKKRNRRQEEWRKNENRLWTKSYLDLDEGALCTRNVKSWSLILLFYLCFYAGLALLWLIVWLVFRLTLDTDIPRVLTDQPGFSYAPVFDGVSNAIIYREADADEVKDIMTKINYMHGKFGPDGHKHFAPCTPNDEYGYTTRNPCIFLKVNRIIGFKTQPYENTFDLPRDAPEELKKYIAALAPNEKKGRIWLSCRTNHTTTIELAFYPQRYVLASAVEVEKKKVYTKPRSRRIDSKFFSALDFGRIVALQMIDVPPDVVLRVFCYIWAKNIDIDEEGKIGRGTIRFTLMIDSREHDIKGDGELQRLYS